MKTKTNIYVIRHGETIWNASQKLQGRQDIPLSERGFIQAREMGQFLKNIPFSFIGTSPLLRTKQTASIISEDLSLHYEVCEGLKARSYGEWEGKNIDEIHQQYEQLFKVIRKWSMEEVFLKAPHETVETYQNVSQRALGFLKDMAHQYSNQNILMVTHSGVITSLLLALNLPTVEIPVISHSGIVKIHHDGEHFSLSDVKGLIDPQKNKLNSGSDRIFVF
jgi:broad specificity phosphatase PhoE